MAARAHVKKNTHAHGTRHLKPGICPQCTPPREQRLQRHAAALPFALLTIEVGQDCTLHAEFRRDKHGAELV